MTYFYCLVFIVCFIAGYLAAMSGSFLNAYLAKRRFSRERELREEIGRERIARLNAGLPPLR